MKEFKIEGLDHVAIRVSNMERSAKWYESVLGLNRHEPEKWDELPIFLMADQTGVAIFPANFEEPIRDVGLKNVKIDHFAFRVSNQGLEDAIEKFKELGIEYEFQDHHHFHSIYILDPDGHVVELTTVVQEVEAS